MNNRQILGSETAKSGFSNERSIASKFKNYINDKDAQLWLEFMGYDIKNIDCLEAKVIPAGSKNVGELMSESDLEQFERFHRFSKADLQVQIEIKMLGIIYRENISAKSTKASASFNQIDKRKVATYQTMWEFSDEIRAILECFTGEKDPLELGYLIEDTEVSKGKRRITTKTMTNEHVTVILRFLNENKYKILSDILIGSGPLKADYMIITTNEEKFNIFKTVDIVSKYSNYNFEKSKRSSFTLNSVFTIQRKGGTPDPTSLQFKFKPNLVIKEMT